MTENENEMEERMRKKKEEEEAMWADYIEQRKQQRAKEEEELKKLKERQVRRKAQRSEQEKSLLAMKKKQEAAKQAEIDEKKAKDAEAKRKRLEESEKKRQAMLDAMKEKDNQGARPNFVISKRGVTSSTVSRAEIVKTKEQLAEDKRIALALRMKKLDIEGLGTEDLRKKAGEMWELIVLLESEKYDLEERRKRQDYDLKELGERQKQLNRNKALKKGLDPEAFTGKYPPKINTSSKYERRVDRRTFGDKKTLFEGGWEEIYKNYIEKSWSERNKEYAEKSSPKLLKWDPGNPRNRETYESRKEAFDDEDEEIDILSFQPKEPESIKQPEPEPEEEEEEEVEAEEEEEEEEEEDEEE